MQEISLKSKLNTNSENITISSEGEPTFIEKDQLFWNGTLRNTRIKKDVGFPSTSGKTIKVVGNEKGVQLEVGGKTLNMPYTSVLAEHYKIENKAAGKQIAHAIWNDRIFTLYKNGQQEYTLVETDKNDKEIAFKKIEDNADGVSAMITSVYNINEEPLIFINQKTKYSITNFINKVSVYKLTEYFDFKAEPKWEYVLDASAKTNIDILKSNFETAVEVKNDKFRLYEIAYDKYVYTQNDMDKKAASDAYNKFLTAENDARKAEEKYLNALWAYDPREEIKYCDEKITQLDDKIVKTNKDIKEIEESNEASLAKKESMENNINNLKERIAIEKDNVYNNSKAPELSPEAEAIKKKEDAKLNAIKKLYDEAYSDWYNEVVAYRENLKKWQGSFSWSWVVSSTESNAGNVTVSGSKMASVLPQSIDTLGRYISTGVEVNVSFPAVGITKGSATVDQNILKVSSKNGNGFTYRTINGVAYLSKYATTDYGFNYNTISNYADVVAKYKVMEERNGAYIAAKEEYNNVMSSNVELANYMAFIKSYEAAVDALKEDEAKLGVLQGQYAELVANIDSIIISLNAKKEELSVFTKSKDDYINQKKRATIRLETFTKVEKIDDNGNIIYTTLEPIFTWTSEDGVPLGDANSGTTFRDSESFKWIVIGFDDDDKNRSRILYWNENDKRVDELKWFGIIDVKGVITGEPIPDPTIFKDITRQSNGTYRWDMTEKNIRIKGSLICGYEFNTVANKYESIVIDEWKQGESVRVNLSANDTLTQEEKDAKKPDPIKFFISNYADSKGIYYDYGPGWVKTYVRKINPDSRQITDCYIYTYGMVSENNLHYMKESVMAKGKTKVWTYEADKLNKRIYTVGGTNKADDSLLGTLPFSVNILPEETNIKTGQSLPTLREQIYGLTPLSFSYNTSLVSNGEDHSGTFQVYTFDDTTIVICSLSMIYVIKKTSDSKYFKIWKTADYYFQTNILSDDNILIEDRKGNINVERGSIPYAQECVLDVEDLALTIPPANQLVTNDTWYWAACYNPFFTKGVNSSYILPAISIPLFIDSAQLEQFQTEALEQRGSILKPMLKGLFDEYDKVDVFYTVATVTTTLYYKTSNIVKTSDIDEDKYDIFGKETYDVDMAGTTYSVATNTQFFPIGVGSIIKGVNYITPTIELEDEYAVRLYTNNNRVYGGYQYAARIFNGTNVFTIYGRNYYYDRQGIYFIGTTSTYTANQFVCYVLGMKYLANSGSEAYFYSEWDKQIYIFTGSNTLQRMTSLSNVAGIKDSIFSSQEQILYLLTEDDKLIMMLEGDVASVDTSGGHLEATELGCAVVNDTEYEIINPYKGENVLPFKLKTSFLGSDSSLSKMAHFDFLVYKVDDKPVTFTLKVDTLNGVERKTEVKDITITPSMWKGRTYRIRFSPRNNVGNSFSVGIYSKDNVAVSFHGWEVMPYGNGSAPMGGK